MNKSNSPAELHGLIDVIDAARRRVLTNGFLKGWSRWWNWILIGLIVAAAFITGLVSVTVAAAVLIVVGAAAIVSRTWRARPSAYDAARRLDSAAGLHDRLSTALYFAQDARPGSLIERQRRDALEKLHNVDVLALFPIRPPATIRRTLALAMAVAALFTYRMYYRPPMIALLQNTARSSLVRSILSPLRQNAENGLQRATSLVNQNAEAAADAKRPAESAQPSDDLWAPAKGAAAGQEDSPGAASGEENRDASATGAGRPSMDQALLDALKAMFANQAPPAGANGQPRQAGQQGNPTQAAPSDGGDERDQQQGADSQQKNPQGTANGAGDTQAGSKELKKSTPLAVKAVPDRVPLQSTNLKDQPRVDVSAEAGTSKLATGTASPQAVNGAGGAEQEDIPARYRSFVQRYFEHADNGRP